MQAKVVKQMIYIHVILHVFRVDCLLASIIYKQALRICNSSDQYYILNGRNVVKIDLRLYIAFFINFENLQT